MKHLVLTTILCLVSLIYYSQDSSQGNLDKYKQLKREAAPYSDEGRIASNQTDLEEFIYDLKNNQLSEFEQSVFNYLFSESRCISGQFLEDALNSSPKDPFLIGEAIEFYGMTEQDASLKRMSEIASKMKLLERDASFYNILGSSLTSRDIIFTNGESDTRPLLLAIARKNIKTRVIRIDWLTDRAYYKSLGESGLVTPSYSKPSQFLSDFIALNPNSTVLISSTLDKEIIQNLNSKLYPDRLALSLVSIPSRVNLDFFEENRENILQSIDELSENALQLNYLPLLLDIHNNSPEGLDSQEKQEIRELVMKILNNNGLEKLISNLLD